MQLEVVVAEADFDSAELSRKLVAGDLDVGAVASFVGSVRAGLGDAAIDAMVLEHYPGMTERSLRDIAQEAAVRWPLQGVSIYHRIGNLLPGEQIVYVGVASRHRHAAFEACEFVMDFLKTDAPFWKKEMKGGNGRWVDARESDREARERWLV